MICLEEALEVAHIRRLHGLSEEVCVDVALSERVRLLGRVHHILNESLGEALHVRTVFLDFFVGGRRNCFGRS